MSFAVAHHRLLRVSSLSSLEANKAVVIPVIIRVDLQRVLKSELG